MHRVDGGPLAASEDQTVADLVVRHPQLRERLEQFGIDYCCGGKRPLRDAVAAIKPIEGVTEECCRIPIAI